MIFILKVNKPSGPIFQISSAALQSLYFPGHEGVIEPLLAKK
jgi:hypothetical protein